MSLGTKKFQDHTITFTTEELAGILAVVLPALDEAPEGFERLENSLVSVAEKISLELGLSPLSIPEPVHVA